VAIVHSDAIDSGAHWLARWPGTARIRRASLFEAAKAPRGHDVKARGHERRYGVALTWVIRHIGHPYAYGLGRRGRTVRRAFIGPIGTHTS
jgi:hypothetical protein